jgi:hypothetical protein
MIMTKCRVNRISTASFVRPATGMITATWKCLVRSVSVDLPRKIWRPSNHGLALGVATVYAHTIAAGNVNASSFCYRASLTLARLVKWIPSNGSYRILTFSHSFRHAIREVTRRFKSIRGKSRVRTWLRIRSFAPLDRRLRFLLRRRLYGVKIYIISAAPFLQTNTKFSIE